VKHLIHTKPVISRIGERARPGAVKDVQGSSGLIPSTREMTKGKKESYHINAVDEVTQWEIVASVSRITEYDLEPLLETHVNQFPFMVRGFHSDNGGEFVNRTGS